MRPCCRALPTSFTSAVQSFSSVTRPICRTNRFAQNRQHCMAASIQLHEVQLKKTEQDLFDILRATTKQAGLKTTLRCAGGWVRDKLLGKDSVDIDVALDDLLGTQFAEHLSTYLQSQGQQAGRIAVVQANPEKSKHLETAKVTINELEVDLVNLRSETYVSDAAHRIPEMTFGTPEQDAFRRDFTFNSMFYNINTAEVEDFTGKGKQDLAAGIVRTPLQPKETFLDGTLLDQPYTKLDLQASKKNHTALQLYRSFEGAEGSALCSKVWLPAGVKLTRSCSQQRGKHLLKQLDQTNIMCDTSGSQNNVLCYPLGSIQQQICHMPVPSTSQSHNVLFFLGNKLIIIKLDPRIVSLFDPRYIMARVSTASLVRQHPTQLILPCKVRQAMSLDNITCYTDFWAKLNP